MIETRYENRIEAGRELAEALNSYAGREHLLVLGLPRGGVPVAREVAEALGAPLDVMIVRKLGVPGQEELAMGAIATGNVRVVNPRVVEAAGILDEDIDAVAAHEQEELRRREQTYRGDRPGPRVEGRCVILVDDGLATGSTMRAAIAAVRQQKPAEVIVAVPVAPPETIESLRDEANAVICPLTPSAFFGIGQWYEDFSQTTDEEVRRLLDEGRR